MCLDWCVARDRLADWKQSTRLTQIWTHDTVTLSGTVSNLPHIIETETGWLLTKSQGDLSEQELGQA